MYQEYGELFEEYSKLRQYLAIKGWYSSSMLQCIAITIPYIFRTIFGLTIQERAQFHIFGCTTELQATSESLRDNSHVGYNPFPLKTTTERSLRNENRYQQEILETQTMGQWQVPGKGEGPSFPFKMQMDNGRGRFPSPLKHRRMVAEEEGVLFEMRTDNGEGDLPCPSKRTTEGRISLCLQKTDGRRQRRGSARKGGGCSSARRNQDNATRRGKPSLRLLESIVETVVSICTCKLDKMHTWLGNG